MERRQRWAGVLMLLLAAGSVAQTAAVRDIDGRRVTLVGPEMKTAVVVFVTNDCPITNSYIPEIERIVADYVPKKVTFYAVYTDAAVTVAAIRKHAKEYGLTMPLIDDTKHELMHRLGATVNPEVAVLGPDGKVVYEGKIDDLYVDLGKRRAAATQHYLRDALDAVLQGRAVKVAKVEPVGCSIYPN